MRLEREGGDVRGHRRVAARSARSPDVDALGLVKVRRDLRLRHRLLGCELGRMSWVSRRAAIARVIRATAEMADWIIRTPCSRLKPSWTSLDPPASALLKFWRISSVGASTRRTICGWWC